MVLRVNRIDDPEETLSSGEDFTGKMMFELNFRGWTGVVEDMCEWKKIRIWFIQGMACILERVKGFQNQINLRCHVCYDVSVRDRMLSNKGNDIVRLWKINVVAEWEIGQGRGLHEMGDREARQVVTIITAGTPVEAEGIDKKEMLQGEDKVFPLKKKWL